MSRFEIFPVVAFNNNQETFLLNDLKNPAMNLANHLMPEIATQNKLLNIK